MASSGEAQSGTAAAVAAAPDAARLSEPAAIDRRRLELSELDRLWSVWHPSPTAARTVGRMLEAEARSAQPDELRANVSVQVASRGRRRLAARPESAGS